MRFGNMRRSGNVEDRRGMGGRTIVGGGLGVGGLIIIVLYLVLRPKHVMLDDDEPGTPADEPDARVG